MYATNYTQAFGGAAGMPYGASYGGYAPAAFPQPTQTVVQPVIVQDNRMNDAWAVMGGAALGATLFNPWMMYGMGGLGMMYGLGGLGMMSGLGMMYGMGGLGMGMGLGLWW